MILTLKRMPNVLMHIGFSYEILISSIKILFETKKFFKLSVSKTTFYNKSNFLKIIGDAFRTDYVCSLSSHFKY